MFLLCEVTVMLETVLWFCGIVVPELPSRASFPSPPDRTELQVWAHYAVSWEAPHRALEHLLCSGVSPSVIFLAIAVFVSIALHWPLTSVSLFLKFNHGSVLA